MTRWALVTLLGALTGYHPSAEAERRILPAPSREGGPSLASVLATRRSVRVIREGELDDVVLGQLLWSAQGVTDGHRTAPSAGALYPLTLWVADARGVWRYVPEDHALVRARVDDRRSQLATAAFDQAPLAQAPMIVVITAQRAITARRYGAKAERYVMLEAGHAAQNLLLTASALGLGAVPIGAFDDREVRGALGLPRDVTMIYLIPIGRG